MRNNVTIFEINLNSHWKVKMMFIRILEDIALKIQDVALEE